MLTASSIAVGCFLTSPPLPPAPRLGRYCSGLRLRQCLRDPWQGSCVLMAPTSQWPPGAFCGPSVLPSFLCCWRHWCSGDKHVLSNSPRLKTVAAAGSDMQAHHLRHSALSRSPSTLPESRQHCVSSKGSEVPWGSLHLGTQNQFHTLLMDPTGQQGLCGRADK